ncbi:MAG TPA: phosphoribosyltransferase family protein [Roseiflexaceae bacterium]|jgi:predicted phosphoribosyltransferase
MTFRFRDRRQAGRQLAAQLVAYANRPDVLVLVLRRGGVPVAFEVARGLDAPLDVFLVHRLGVPGREALAMGAITTGGIVVRDDAIVDTLGIPDHILATVAADEQQELERREHAYRGDRLPPEVRGRVAILVDDGHASAVAMHAAVTALRQQQPVQLVVAVPIAAPEIYDTLRAEADAIVCAITPESFDTVDRWYDDRAQPTDDEIRDLLERAAREHAGLARAYSA